MPFIGQSATNIAKNVWEYATRTLTDYKIRILELSDPTEYSNGTVSDWLEVKRFTDVFAGANVVVLGFVLQVEVRTDGGGQWAQVRALLKNGATGYHAFAPKVKTGQYNINTYISVTAYSDGGYYNFCFPVRYPLDVIIELYNSSNTAGTNYIRNIKVWIAYIEV